MPSVDAAPLAAAPLFAALGDRTRLSLVIRLSDGAARSIATLALDTALTRQAIAKHLRVLEEAGLVVSARAGRESRFTLVPAPIADLRTCLEAMSARWDAALGRLKALVE